MLMSLYIYNQMYDPTANVYGKSIKDELCVLSYSWYEYWHTDLYCLIIVIGIRIIERVLWLLKLTPDIRCPWQLMPLVCKKNHQQRSLTSYIAQRLMTNTNSLTLIISNLSISSTLHAVGLCSVQCAEKTLFIRPVTDMDLTFVIWQLACVTPHIESTILHLWNRRVQWYLAHIKCYSRRDEYGFT